MYVNLRMAKAGRMGFPSSYEVVAECDGSVTSEPDTEIWLIRTPPDFTPESLNARRLPLPGYKMQKVKCGGGVKKFLHVFSSPSPDPPLRAFLCPPLGSGDRLLGLPSFEGTMTVAEAHGDLGDLHSVPDRPPLALPPGLKPRFQPFGAPPPRTGNANQSLPSGDTRKMKKSKKRKRDQPEH
ncbi:DNA-directed RNA polymerase I subunit RPA34 [Mantella aurantiaca]